MGLMRLVIKYTTKDGMVATLITIKRFLMSLIISLVFPPVSGVVVGMLKLLIPDISSKYIAVALGFFVVLTILRWSLEPKLNLIKEYKSLMILLEKLTARNKSTSIWQVVMDTLRNKKKLRPSWVYYFDEKGKNVNIAFCDLNDELEKLISNPYRLWNKDMLSIGDKFKSLVVDNKELYKAFIEMINTESISKDVFNYDEIKKEHNDFYYRLKQSLDEYAELRALFIDEFFSPLPDIWFPNRTEIY